MKNYYNFINENISNMFNALIDHNIDAVKGFMKLNNDINLQDEDGNTLLIIASQRGKLLIVKHLLKQENIDINLKNKLGDTALTIALLNFWTTISSLLILRKDLDLDKNSNNKPLLHLIAENTPSLIFDFLNFHTKYDWKQKYENKYFWEIIHKGNKKAVLKTIELSFPKIYSEIKKLENVKKFKL